MMTDTELRIKGVQILAQYLGDIEMERFIALIQREPFDYTHWRQAIDSDRTIEDIRTAAMELRLKKSIDVLDPDNTPDEVVIAGIQQGFKEALSGQLIPLEKMWNGIDVE